MPLVGSRTVEHVSELAKVYDILLTVDEVRTLSKEFVKESKAKTVKRQKTA
jgi:diketogulonate reductase-like aldo/keto reductase